jgi:thioester reductase-like protein
MEVHGALIFSDHQNSVLASALQNIIDRRVLFNSAKVNEQNQCEWPGISHVCYMITTSGTTGVPKGISVTHSNVMHYGKQCLARLNTNDVLRCGHVTNLSTDLGHTNWLMSLMSGGMLRIFNGDESTDPRRFKTVVETDKINFIKTTRSHFDAISSLLLKEKVALKYLFLGGEKLHWQFVDRLYEANNITDIYNHYGPSETTIGALLYKIPRVESTEYKASTVPIGTAIGDNKAYLINVKNGLGELCIEGPGVSQGYYNPQAQNNFFVNDKTKELAYRTGDICKELSPGLFEFCNRLDRQVKINGYRVELDEIEAAINASPQVNYSKLNTTEVNGDLVLEAYIKPIDIVAFDKDTFIADLGGKLSNYKIPNNLYIQEFCTYHRNGKIDFDQMRKKSNYSCDEKFNSWESWELSVEHCWSSVLGKPVVKKLDDFFESGGNSLSAMRFIAKLQIKGYDVGIADLNQNSILVNFIRLNKKQLFEKKQQEEVAVSNALTIPQIDFFRSKWSNPNNYCQSILLETTASIHINAFSKAIFELKNAHFELNQSYFDIQRGFYTDNSHPVDHLEIYYLAGNLPVSCQIIEISNQVNQKIKLSTGELLKVALIFNEAAQKNYVYISCHHLATDIVSWDILLDELINNYKHIKNGDSTERVEMERLKNDFYNVNQENNLLALPPLISKEIYRLPRKHLANNEKRTGNFVINCTLSESDIATSKQNNQYLYSFSRSILKHFGLDKVSIDTEFHGRPSSAEIDISRSVSWWAVSLPLDFEKGQDLIGLNKSMLSCAKYANEINIFANDKNKSVFKKADIRFNFLGDLPEKFSNSELTLNLSDVPTTNNRDFESEKEFLIVFTCRIIGQDLIADFQYDRDHFDEADIYAVSQLFLQGIKSPLSKPSGVEIEGREPILLPSNISSIGKPFFKVQKNAFESNVPKEVLLTGATGFLGIYLLRELLLNNVKVYCIVRGLTNGDSYNRLKEQWEYYFPAECIAKYQSRLLVYAGDLADENFGLKKSDFETLSKQVESVVHCAADVNLSKSLEELMVTNTAIIDKLVAFSRLSINKSIHHVSTLAVCGVWKKGTIFSETTFDGDQAFVSNYEHSKFLAEKKVREAIHAGVEAKIYRVGHIAGDSITGKFQRNSSSNRVVQLINGMIELGAIPESFDEKISFSHVDIVAKMLVNVVLKKVTTGKICLHLENSNYNTLPVIGKMCMQSSQNIRILKDEAFEQLINNYLKNNIQSDTILKMQFWLNRNENNKRNIKFNNQYSNDLFARQGLVFHAIKEDWLTQFLSKLSVNSNVMKAVQLIE